MYYGVKANAACRCMISASLLREVEARRDTFMLPQNATALDRSFQCSSLILVDVTPVHAQPGHEAFSSRNQVLNLLYCFIKFAECLYN